MSAEPAAPGLRAAVEGLFGPAARLVDDVPIKRGVRRLRFTTAGHDRRLIVKRLDPQIARRNRLVATRWLPAAGLADLGPQLLATAAEPDGESVWLVYEDVSGGTLADAGRTYGDRAGAIRSVARLHLAFAGSARQGEHRLWGAELGIGFTTASVRDAAAALRALCPPAVDPDSELSALRDRLLRRLEDLVAELPERASELRGREIPETLLHGDLWPANVVLREDDGVCLIDWDHAGLGPVTYDLSTFLARSPGAERDALLATYRRAVASAGWDLPRADVLDRLFETHELGRISNRVIWPAIAILDGDRAWGPAALAEIERWFGALRPLLAVETAP